MEEEEEGEEEADTSSIQSDDEGRLELSDLVGLLSLILKVGILFPIKAFLGEYKINPAI